MSSSDRYSRSSVGSSIASTGSWLASTPIEPTAVRVESISISSLKTSPSGVRTSTGNLVRAIIDYLRGASRPTSCSGRRTSGRPLPFGFASFAFARLDHFLDGSLEEEGALGHLVVLALDDPF